MNCVWWCQNVSSMLIALVNANTFNKTSLNNSILQLLCCVGYICKFHKYVSETHNIILPSPIPILLQSPKRESNVPTIASPILRNCSSFCNKVPITILIHFLHACNYNQNRKNEVLPRQESCVLSYHNF